VCVGKRLEIYVQQLTAAAAIAGGEACNNKNMSMYNTVRIIILCYMVNAW